MKLVASGLMLVVPLLTSCATTLWQASGSTIHNTNAGNVGVGTTSPDSKLTVVESSTTPVQQDTAALSAETSSPTNASAIYGAAVNSKSVFNYGGYFTAAGESSGVFGEASDTENGSAGGVFHSHGKYGKGVIGIALNTGDNIGNFGGWFDARGQNGVGIFAKGGPQGIAAQFIGNVQIASAQSRDVILELGEGLDLAEGFDLRAGLDDDVVVPGTVLVIDDKNPGRLMISAQPYDTRVAGIVAGGNGLPSGVRLGSRRFDAHVALAGRVYCKADATHGAIKPGDLLTTSSVPGYAMKAIDLSRTQGAVIGKAMQHLEKGKRGEILVLVTLQ